VGRLDGRVAIVTGGGRGVGGAIARTLAAEGASVVVNDLGTALDGAGVDGSVAAQMADQIRAAGGAAVADTTDVTSFAATAQLIARAVEEFGRLDALVNVAGNIRDRMIFNMAEEEWDSVIAVHLKGTFNTTRHAAAYWRSNPGGAYRLINCASRAGIFGGPTQPNYAAAKMGIVGLTMSCSNALRKYGVTSNCISPSANTRMLDGVDPALTASLGFGSDTAMSPANVAPAVAYLASEQSGWINGRIIGAGGRRFTLYHAPAVEREIVSTVDWEVDAAFEAIESAFRPGIERSSPFGN
jgi:NAD(P)-dependent dehydrogenase (short-subunit alcohol dehydrogenase family)